MNHFTEPLGTINIMDEVIIGEQQSALVTVLGSSELALQNHPAHKAPEVGLKPTDLLAWPVVAQ